MDSIYKNIRLFKELEGLLQDFFESKKFLTPSILSTHVNYVNCIKKSIYKTIAYRMDSIEKKVIHNPKILATIFLKKCV